MNADKILFHKREGAIFAATLFRGYGLQALKRGITKAMTAMALFMLSLGPVEDVMAQSLDVDTGFNAGVFTRLTEVKFLEQPDGKVIMYGNFAFVDGVPQWRIVRFNTDGTIDSGFEVPVDVQFKDIRQIVLQSDGRLLVCGDFTRYDGVAVNKLIRLNADGTRDTGFAIPFTSGWFQPNAAAVQPDGRILVAGGISTSFGSDGTYHYGVVRFESNGALDSTYNSGLYDDYVPPEIKGLVIQSNGKAVIFASTEIRSGSGKQVERLGVNGGVDSTFFFWMPYVQVDLRTMILLPDDKILLAGSFYDPDNWSHKGLVMYHEDGSLDYSSLASINDTVHSVARQSDGKLLIGGDFTSVGGNQYFRLARLDSWGYPDTTFSVPFPQSSSGQPFVETVFPLSDGKIMVAGNVTSLGGVGVSGVFRLNGSGSLDTEFTTTVQNPGVVNAVAESPDGTVFVGGTFTMAGSLNRALIAAFDPTGTPTDFNVPSQPSTNGVNAIVPFEDGGLLVGGGFTQMGPRNFLARISSTGTVMTTPPAFPGLNASVADLARQPDGKIVAVGTFNHSSRRSIVRFNANGTVDPTFTSPFTSTANIRSVAIQPDGGILIGGAFTTVGEFPRNRVARLTSSGELDQTFDPGDGVPPLGIVHAVRPLADGKILVGGQFSSFAGNSNYKHLVRLESNGALDTTFTPSLNNTVFAVETIGDKVLIGGTFTNLAGTSRRNFARLHADGSVDATLTAAIPNGTVNAISVQADGGVLLAGSFTEVDELLHPGVARLALLAPVILVSPQSLSIDPGDEAIFTVQAGGAAPLSYQWWKDGEQIEGATEATYTVPEASTADAGSYSVEVTNTYGSVMSDAAVLSISAPPTIIQHPGSQSLPRNQTATLTVQAVGPPPLSYQWYFGNFGDTSQPVGSNTATFVTPVLGASAIYWVAVTNPHGTVNAGPAIITVGDPPVISGPDSGSSVLGGSVSFSVQVSGTGPFSYQWRRNGFDIPGAVSATYEVSPVVPESAGSYSVFVSNVFGSAVSASATLSINTPPGIVTGLESQSVVEGDTVTFSVEAGGDAPISYVWYFNNVVIPGETGSSLVLGSVTTGDAGTYRVTVSNPYGSVSSTCTLTVNQPAFITFQPIDRAIAPGATAVLNVSAGGTTPIGYQWYRGIAGDTSLPVGSNSASYTTPALNEDASYFVVVSNAYGSATSRTVQVRVGLPPTITTHPQSTTSLAGTQLSLSVVASGATPLSYQWFKNGELLPGETGSSLMRMSVAVGDAGNYHVAVSNLFGSVTSNTAEVVVNVPPSITQHPLDQTVLAGNPATFSVVAIGTDPLTYEWQRNSLTLPGETGTTLSIAAATAENQGDYTVMVTNDYGSATSIVAVLVVNSPPTVVSNPQSKNLAVGNATTLTVTANGTGTLSYQWYQGTVGDTSQPVGENNPSMETPLLTQTTTYWVRVSNEYGIANSLAATITVGQPPVITTEPVSQTVSSGMDAQLSVAVSGDGPFTYAWWHNSSAVVGTGATLTLLNTTPSDAGDYYVVVSNAFGNATSLTATVTVQSLPVVETHPQNVIAAQGGTAVFSVTATGAQPLSYQWKKDGQIITGETALSLTLSPVQLSDAGDYSVVVTNSFGSDESNIAVLTVQAPPTITQQPAYRMVATGSPVTLSVQAAGSSPFTYEWYRGEPGDTSVPVGTNSSILDLGNIYETSTFWVRVSNAHGTVDSQGAVITTGDPPSITTHPTSVVAGVGDTVTLEVMAVGTGQLNYSWKRGGTEVGTGPELVLYDIQQAEAGNYSALVTNDFGSATSAVATVTVLIQPYISAHPQSQVVAQGNTATFSVTATGSGPLAYQWFKDGEPIPGETNPALILTDVGLGNEASYTVQVSNEVGSAISEAATLQVNAPPVIVQSPNSTTVMIGQSAVLQVYASGSGPLLYQWYRGQAGDTGSPVGIDSFELVTEPLMETMAFWVRVSNDFGVQDSEVATVTIHDPVPVINSPVTATAGAGSLFVYRILATANPSQFGASGLPEGLSIDPLTGYISGVPLEDGEFEIELSAATATQTGTKILTLTVYPSIPVITSAMSAVGRIGQLFTYQIVATQSPESYDANNLPSFLSVGSTGLISGIPTAAGQYVFQISATNTGGLALQTVVLTVLSSDDPPILTGPSILTGRVGTYFSHTLTATNDPASFSAVGLPEGLTLNAETGVISGVPLETGTYVAEIRSTNANGESQPRDLTFSIAPPLFAPVIESVSIPRIHQGDSVVITVLATNSPSLFTASGLPIGLSINSVTGQISGNPAVPGTYTVILRASNSGGTSPDYPVTILVRPPRQTPVIQNPASVSGRLTVPMELLLTASNGPLEFRADNLPGGLTLDSATGLISGTPTDMGRFPVSVAARNDDGWGPDLTLTFTIGSIPTAPVLNPVMAAMGRIGEAFQYRVQATEDPTAFTAMDLPPGLTMHPELGLIGGTPTHVGIFDVTITAINDLGESTPGVLRITIQAPLGAPEITSAPTARGRLEEVFSYTITASNHANHFSATGLPPGLTRQGATISGIPTEAGEFSVELAASNASRGFGTPMILTITIETGNVRPRITSAAGVSASQGESFNYQITAVNGPVTGYSVENLPPGLSFDAETGLISGQPVDAGRVAFRVNASNAGGSGPGMDVWLTVNPAPTAPVVYSGGVLSGYSGDPFSYQIRATGSPSRYRVSGLPNGLTLNPGTGQISGTLGSTGTYHFKVAAENDAGFGADFAVTLTVSLLRSASRIDGPVSVEGFVNETLYIKPAYSNLSFWSANYIRAFVDDDSWWHYYDSWDQQNQRWVTKPARTGITGFWTQIYSSDQTGDARRIVVNIKSRLPEMRVTSPTLVYARVGEPWSYQVTAAGSPASFDFRFVGNHPGGLVFDEDSGLLSGTPQTPGTFSALVSALTSIGEEGPSREITVVVNPAAGSSEITGGTSENEEVESFNFSTFSSFYFTPLGETSEPESSESSGGLSASGQVGVAFSYTLEASGDVYEFQAEGLPPGLALNPATGEISGQPESPGEWEVTLRAINEFGPGPDAILILTIEAAVDTPVITSSGVALATVGVPFEYQITASNTPLGFNAASLPAWASLDDQTGIISGLPDEPGIHTITLSANNTFGVGEGRGLSLSVAAAEGTPVITSPATAIGAEGEAFAFQLTATNEPDVFSAHTLPAGLLLDQETGLISGVPMAKGTFAVRVWAYNEAGEGAASDLVIEIGAASDTPIITSQTSITGRVGVPLNFGLEASGDPVSYTVGALPQGLTVNGQTGEISGVPLAVGEYEVQVFATNVNGSGDPVALTISITEGAETYAEWASRVGIPHDQTDPLLTPFGDGITNLLRFALGLEIDSPDYSRLPKMEVWDEGGTRQFALVFTRSTDAAGITFVLRGASEPSGFEEVQSALEILETVDAFSERVRLRQTSPVTDEARWFLRLRIMLVE